MVPMIAKLNQLLTCKAALKCSTAALTWNAAKISVSLVSSEHTKNYSGF